MFSHGFPWFSYGFPIVFLCFSYGFPIYSFLAFRMLFLCFSYGFPMVFLLFSYGLPIPLGPLGSKAPAAVGIPSAAASADRPGAPGGGAALANSAGLEDMAIPGSGDPGLPYGNSVYIYIYMMHGV